MSSNFAKKTLVDGFSNLEICESFLPRKLPVIVWYLLNLNSLFSRDIGANSKTMKGCGKHNIITCWSIYRCHITYMFTDTRTVHLNNVFMRLKQTQANKLCSKLGKSGGIRLIV